MLNSSSMKQLEPAARITTKQDYNILSEFADISEELNSGDETEYLSSLYNFDYEE